MIPEPTAEDLARDAEADWTAIHSVYNDPALIPSKCPTEWVLAWIRRAEYYRNEADINLTCARVEAELGDEARAELSAALDELQAIADYCGERLGTDPSLCRPTLAVVQALVAYLEVQEADLQSTRIALEAEVAHLKSADLGAMQACLERLEAENARLKAEAQCACGVADPRNCTCEPVGCPTPGACSAANELGRLRDENAMAMTANLVHTRLDAMGVPACETERCEKCKKAAKEIGLGEYECPASSDCPDCKGTGQRPVVCRITARLDWVAKVIRETYLKGEE